MRISKSVEKRTTYAVGMSIVTLACILLFLIGQETGIAGVYALMLAAGMGLSTNYVMPCIEAAPNRLTGMFFNIQMFEHNGS